MTWLLPTVKLEKTDICIDGQVVYTTEVDFSTRFILKNWSNRIILELRLFGFGFRKVWLYENK